VLIHFCFQSWSQSVVALSFLFKVAIVISSTNPLILYSITVVCSCTFFLIVNQYTPNLISFYLFFFHLVKNNQSIFLYLKAISLKGVRIQRPFAILERPFASSCCVINTVSRLSWVSFVRINIFFCLS